ncbi:hypothetical protein BDW69DRAFT_189300 [Aspergillus filifer]
MTYMRATVFLMRKITDFGRASTIGQPLQGILPPWAMPILAGPLKGTHGLCSARTEQSAVVYGHEPYDDDRSPPMSTPQNGTADSSKWSFRILLAMKSSTA